MNVIELNQLRSHLSSNNNAEDPTLIMCKRRRRSKPTTTTTLTATTTTTTTIDDVTSTSSPEPLPECLLSRATSSTHSIEANKQHTRGMSTINNSDHLSVWFRRKRKRRSDHDAHLDEHLDEQENHQVSSLLTKQRMGATCEPPTRRLSLTCSLILLVVASLSGSLIEPASSVNTPPTAQTIEGKLQVATTTTCACRPARMFCGRPERVDEK